ncbi:DoxX family protein [Luteimicrobium sp. DT211]|uniref:DoxX family protein n=1 Tax=Luteimicrobium sp. DT211 TaxID=3393412 RepID=UPI003CF874D0
MDVVLWVVTGLLAAVFLFAGTNKLVIPREKLLAAPGGGWVDDFDEGFVKALGAAEVLGAVGLVVPGAVGAATFLVPLAATGVGLVMVGAAVVEVRRGEPAHALLNLFYLALAVFLVWGRLGPAPLG